MTSKNGGSLMIGFSGTIHGRLNYMPVMYEGKRIYRSIVDGTEARVRPPSPLSPSPSPPTEMQKGDAELVPPS
jgi:hypothetical protein